MKLASSKNKKNTVESKNSKSLKIILLSFISVFIIYIITCTVSLIMDIKIDNYHIISLISFSAACFISGLLAGSKIRKNGLINGIIFTLPSIIAFNGLSFVLNKSDINYMFVLFFIIEVISSAVGGVISVNIKRNPLKIKR